MENLIHIVFDAPGAENLRQSFALDDIIQGKVLLLEDDLAFGPLETGPAAAGALSRQQWWDILVKEESYTGIASDAEKLTELCGQMREDENNEIWIWAAQNARDVSGYYALLERLGDFIGRVHLIYLNNLPFINEKGSLFYPSYLGEILPKEFLKARKLAREITPAEAEVDGEEWQRLKTENACVRILEGGKKLRGEETEYFDSELINRCRLEYVKGWRLINQVRQKVKAHIPEEFLYRRLDQLIESGVLETKEPYKNSRDAEVKVAGTSAAPQAEPLNDQNDVIEKS